MLNLRILALLLFVAGCSGNIRYPDADIAAPSNPPKAYVTNPEMTKELAILKASGLYAVSADASAPVRITLWPLVEKPYFCGNPYLGFYISALTLGLIPASSPSTYQFGFDIEDQDGRRELEFRLAMEYRYSIWETFRLFHNENKELAKALRGSALGENDPWRLEPGAGFPN